MSKQDKQGATLLAETLQNKDFNTTTTGFTDVDDTIIEIGHSDPQPSDTADTSNTPTPPQPPHHIHLHPVQL